MYMSMYACTYTCNDMCKHTEILIMDIHTHTYIVHVYIVHKYNVHTYTSIQYIHTCTHTCT